MAPGARSKYGAPIFDLEVFRNEMYCIEESNCEIVGIFRRHPQWLSIPILIRRPENCTPLAPPSLRPCGPCQNANLALFDASSLEIDPGGSDHIEFFKWWLFPWNHVGLMWKQFSNSCYLKTFPPTQCRCFPIRECCNRKPRSENAQNFTLWHQATVELYYC